MIFEPPDGVKNLSALRRSEHPFLASGRKSNTDFVFIDSEVQWNTVLSITTEDCCDCFIGDYDG